jgi:hypothetical protein
MSQDSDRSTIQRRGKPLKPTWFGGFFTGVDADAATQVQCAHPTCRPAAPRRSEHGCAGLYANEQFSTWPRARGIRAVDRCRELPPWPR